MILVLVAIAVFLLFASEVAARTVREAKITYAQSYSEAAFYAADGGFNRARARLTTAQGKTSAQMDTMMAALNGRTETLYDSSTPISQYALQVTKTGPLQYRVISTGTATSESTTAKRVVTGTLQVTTSPTFKVTTVYQP